MNDEAVSPQYVVVVNDEEQYSIWFADRELPNGWREGGPRGARDECLRYIEAVWTDLTPATIRASLAHTKRPAGS